MPRQPCPSTLTIYWPSPDPPDPDLVRSRMEPYAALDPAGAEEGAESPRWTQSWRSPYDDRLHLRVRPRPANTIEGAFLVPQISDACRVRAAAASWVVECRAHLDPKDPLASFGRQLRFATIACPDAPAIFDEEARRVLDPAQFLAIASWSAAPPPTELYMIHSVFPCRHRPSGDAPGPYWLHTHGLQRAGLPDVELMRVPADLMNPAADLIRAFVTSHLGERVPPRGICGNHVGDRPIGWLPVREAIRTLQDGDVGGRADRGRTHQGRRIALVEPPPFGPTWMLPFEHLRMFQSGKAVHALPERESERSARLARDRWPEFESLHRAHSGDAGWSFHASIGVRTRHGPREFLWWTVLAVEPERVRARLENHPVDVPGLERGQVAWHALDEIADWRVRSPESVVRPDSVRRSG